jgi:hypothetical protein
MHKCTNNFDKMKMTSIFQKKWLLSLTAEWIIFVVTGISVLSYVFVSPNWIDSLGDFLSSMNGSSVTFVGGVVRDVFQSWQGGSLSTNGRLLPQSFDGDGVIGNAFGFDCFLATGGDGMSGVFSGSDKLMVLKWCVDG